MEQPVKSDCKSLKRKIFESLRLDSQLLSSKTLDNGSRAPIDNNAPDGVGGDTKRLNGKLKRPRPSSSAPHIDLIEEQPKVVPLQIVKLAETTHFETISDDDEPKTCDAHVQTDLELLIPYLVRLPSSAELVGNIINTIRELDKTEGQRKKESKTDPVKHSSIATKFGLLPSNAGTDTLVMGNVQKVPNPLLNKHMNMSSTATLLGTTNSARLSHASNHTAVGMVGSQQVSGRISDTGLGLVGSAMKPPALYQTPQSSQSALINGQMYSKLNTRPTAPPGLITATGNNVHSNGGLAGLLPIHQPRVDNFTAAAAGLGAQPNANLFGFNRPLAPRPVQQQPAQFGTQPLLPAPRTHGVTMNANSALGALQSLQQLQVDQFPLPHDQSTVAAAAANFFGNLAAAQQPASALPRPILSPAGNALQMPQPTAAGIRPSNLVQQQQQQQFRGLKGNGQPEPEITTTPSMTMDISRICSVCCGKAQFICSGCKSDWYCGRACQLKAWSTHGSRCTMIQQQRAGGQAVPVNTN